MSSPSVENPQNIVDAAQPVPHELSLQLSNGFIGTGSTGTIVYRSSYKGDVVAIKRMQNFLVKPIKRELDILNNSEGHPNIIRYIDHSSDVEFCYIVLELCPASLADIMERPDAFQDIKASFVHKDALMEITSGLAHLHALRLVHRDIKPRNVLVSQAKDGKHRMLIADFGLCKQLDLTRVSFTATAPCTPGWRAPEVLDGGVKIDGAGAGEPDTQSPAKQRQTQLVDIFSLGCLYYYVLTEGGHPFGVDHERDLNIKNGAKKLERLQDLVAVHAIERMLSPKAEDRPDATTCLLHPYLWEAGRMLSSLQEELLRLQNIEDGMRGALENDAQDVVGQDWRAALNLVPNAIQLPDNVRNKLGKTPEAFLKYFADTSPKLFLRVHNVVSSLRGE